MSKFYKIIYISIFLNIGALWTFPVYSQMDLRNVLYKGKVHDQEGRGLPNVAVTDGLNIVQTNECGYYELLSNASAEFIYISIPAGYEVEIVDDSPRFYYEVPKEEFFAEMTVDFELYKLDKSDEKHVVITWADPQIYYEEELFQLEQGAEDVRKLIKNEYDELFVYGLVLGDMIGWFKDADKLIPPIKKLINNIDIPFYYAVGNHDVDLNLGSNKLSKAVFKKHFGPNYYSFNKGKIHYIVLDNVYSTGNGGYIGYIEEEQLNWLEQDLKMVPEGSTIILIMHIPSYSPFARDKNYGKEQKHKVLQNRESLYSLLRSYNAHIFSGHEHYLENYVIQENLFEHVHTTLSGLFWMAPWSWDGSPRGYTVYEVEGDKVKWYFKSIGKDKNYQFQAYPVGTNHQMPDAVTVNVWNYDPEWKVYWYEDNVKKGEMTQFIGYDSSIVNYVENNSHNFKHKGIGAMLTAHMFYAVPSSKDSDIKVEVVDRFGNIFYQELVKGSSKYN